MKNFDHLVKRRAELGEIFERLREAHKNAGPLSALVESLERFHGHLLSLDELIGPAAEDVAPYQQRKQMQRAIISAQVEADKIEFPSVDPSEGWLRYKDPDPASADDHVVDSQLARYFISATAGGELTHLEYKPRKVDLADRGGTVGIGSTSTEFLLNSLPAPLVDIVTPSELLFAEPTIVSVPRKSLDLLGLRFDRPVNRTAKSVLPGAKPRLVKDFLFRGGIGAHHKEATTGFSVDYWFDDIRLANKQALLVSEWNVTLPTGIPSALSARALTSVGGIADRAVSLEHDVIFEHNKVDGGLNGLRLIDGVNGLFVELRWSRPLIAALAVARYAKGDRFTSLMGNEAEAFERDGEEFVGVTLQFVVPARYVESFEGPITTLHFSIV